MVQCDRGFTPVAPFEVMCTGGEWLVDGEAPRCTPVDCGKPKIENAEICKLLSSASPMLCQVSCMVKSL
jgi:hypothetical protein